MALNEVILKMNPPLIRKIKSLIYSVPIHRKVGKSSYICICACALWFFREFFPSGALHHPKNSEWCSFFNASLLLPALFEPKMTKLSHSGFFKALMQIENLLRHLLENLLNHSNANLIFFKNENFKVLGKNSSSQKYWFLKQVFPSPNNSAIRKSYGHRENFLNFEP